MRRQKGKRYKQSFTDLSSAHRRSPPKCQLVQTSYIKRIELPFFQKKRNNNGQGWRRLTHITNQELGKSWPNFSNGANKDVAPR